MATILVADDDPELQFMIKAILLREGHQVMQAKNGAEALAFLGVDPPVPPPTGKYPDAVILDVMMPRQDGYSVASRMLENELTREIPIVVLTARVQTQDVFRSLPNVAAYVSKPFEIEALRQAVRSALDKKS